VALHFWSSEKVIQYSRGFAGNDQAVTVEEKLNYPEKEAPKK
jgi:hypothetical protein